MRSLHAISAAVFGCLLTAPAAFAAAQDPEDQKVDLPSGSDAAAGAEASGGGSIVRTIVGLAVVLGVIYGLHWVLKQIKASKDSAAVAGTSLETLATLPLGANRALHLIRAGSEIVLVGTAEHGVTPIRRYTEEEAQALGLLDPPLPVGATLASLEAEVAPKGFLNTLRSKTVVK